MDLETKVRDKLQQIAHSFDFNHFSMAKFVKWVEGERRREIQFIGWSMPIEHAIFGAWITDSEQPIDYIFYHQESPAIHQLHIQLHELSHILCGHTTLNEVEVQELGGLCQMLLCRGSLGSGQMEVEQEAELMALRLYDLIPKDIIHQPVMIASSPVSESLMRKLVGLE
jgi:hypothetical protein